MKQTFRPSISLFTAPGTIESCQNWLGSTQFDPVWRPIVWVSAKSDAKGSFFSFRETIKKGYFTRQQIKVNIFDARKYSRSERSCFPDCTNSGYSCCVPGGPDRRRKHKRSWRKQFLWPCVRCSRSCSSLCCRSLLQPAHWLWGRAAWPRISVQLSTTTHSWTRFPM